MVPLYVVVGSGFLWTWLRRRYDTDGVTDLVMNVGAPCLVFSSLVDLQIEPSAMVEMVGAMLAALACFSVFGSLALRVLGMPRHLLPPVVFGNSGNMGLPVCLFAFGDAGLALAICIYATNAFTQFTAGLWLWSGVVSFRQLAKTPLAWATVLAAAVIAFGIPVPLTVRRTTELLGDFTIPLMGFTLGVTLGRLRIADLGAALALSLLRIGVGIVVGVALADLFEFGDTERGVFILQCSMPVAVINYLLAERYQRDPAQVASAIVVSTLVSLATLPLLLAWLLPK